MTMTKFSRINKQREEITMRVLEDMEKGGNEWKKPWVEASPLPPHNPVSGTQYSGRNFLYTYVYGMMRGYADPRWATEMPISRWTKTAIIQAVKDYCFDFDLAYDPDIENNTKAELVKEFLEYKSWHHSSRTAREVEFFGLNEDAVCRSFEQMSQEQVIERDRQMAAEQAAQEARLQFMNAREKEFEQKFGCNPSSVLAYETVHPEMCTRFIARRKKTEMISYRLPAEAVKAGMKEEQVCPVAYAGHSRVGYFDVFMQGTGKKRHWEDVDFEALAEKFDEAAEKGKRAKMQPKARLDAKKTCVDEAMRVMREQTDISGDKAKCARITDISRKRQHPLRGGRALPAPTQARQREGQAEKGDRPVVEDQERHGRAHEVRQV